MPSAEQTVRSTIAEDGIATVTLDRPEKLNALNRATLAQLAATLRAVAEDERTFVIVLTGTGRGFSAGDDLIEAQTISEEDFAEQIADFQAVTRTLLTADQPSVAAINGHAYGAGLELSLACDFRLAAPRATFACPETRLGWTITNAASALLPRIIGEARARSLILLGEPISASTALEYGLVNEVLPAPELMPAARALAARLAALSPTGVALSRRLLLEAWSRAFEDVLAAESLAVRRAFATEGEHGEIERFGAPRHDDTA